MVSNVKKYCAEAIGTAVLVFMGCGAAVFLGADASGGHLAVALAFGLSIVAMAYVIGSISGCHINPAVSLAMFMDKRLSLKDFIGYVVAQIVGGVVGAALLKWIAWFAGFDKTGALGSNGVSVVGVGGALVVEIVLTFIFVLVILAVTSDPAKGGLAGIVIGLTLTFVHIVGIPLTGTSVNPARSIGPALFAGGDALKSLWVFILAPLVGAAIAAIVWAAFRERRAAR
ncbi:MAG: MIP family channel protein [Firmicutes bacterium]|nr:MIP family channel protein [Bacillota bacterium]